MDTLRWDHVGSYGHERDTTPAIDALAEAGVRFDAAYSTAPWTTPSVASILTGLYPSAHGIKTLNDGLSESALTLAEILQGRGFQTGGVISHTLLVDGEGNRFGQGFDIYLEREAKGHNHVSTNGVTEQATRMLEGFAIDGRPFFMFVHYFDPHFNFLRHPEIGYAAPRVGRLDGTQHISEIVDMRASLTLAEIDFLRDLYDEEIAFTDRGIGRLLRALTDSGLDDETAIVLTADHGEEFRERGWIGHTRTLFNELVRVPLVVLDPGARHAGTAVAEPVTLAALTPTLLDLLGIGFDAGQFQADSFAAALRNPDAFESGAAFIEVDFDPLYAKNEIKRAHKKALVLGRHKIVRDDTTGAVAVFDLHADPAETSDLSRTEPELVRLLGKALERYVKFSSARGVEPSRQTYDEREIELLRGLGYVD